MVFAESSFLKHHVNKLCFLYAVSGIKRKLFYTWVCARECGLFDHVNICRFLKSVYNCRKEWMIKVKEKCGENGLLVEPHMYAVIVHH